MRRSLPVDGIVHYLPVPLSSAAEDQARLASYGAAWVPKPLHIDELLKTLERV